MGKAATQMPLPGSRRRLAATEILRAFRLLLLIVGFASHFCLHQANGNHYYTCHDDLSWAVNTQEVTGRREEYLQFIRGCSKALDIENCQKHEAYRLHMNYYQPRSLYNYTKTGFMKAKVSSTSDLTPKEEAGIFS